jgi:hypothetical protein
MDLSQTIFFSWNIAHALVEYLTVKNNIMLQFNYVIQFLKNLRTVSIHYSVFNFHFILIKILKKPHAEFQGLAF